MHILYAFDNTKNGIRKRRRRLVCVYVLTKPKNEDFNRFTAETREIPGNESSFFFLPNYALKLVFISIQKKIEEMN